MPQYSEKDFGSLLFNPLSKKKMIEAYPKLSEVIHPDYIGDALLDNIIRYVIMVYDPKSILVTNEKDLNFRKGIAAELAGFDTENETLMEEIYSCKNEVLLGFIIKYLIRFPRSKEWAAICAFEGTYWESIKKLLEPIEKKDTKSELEAVQKKAAIKNEVDADIIRLEQYYSKFFGDDAALEGQAKQRYTPESVGKLKQV